MKRLVVAVTLLLASLGLAAASLTERLNELVDAGQMEQAYNLAFDARDRLAGDPAFDLPFGIAAIDSGHLNEGVFALERVLFLQPNNHRARLEYARGLFLLGDDAEARQEFTRVLEHANPPPSVTDKVEQFLAAIRRRESRYQTTARGYLGFGLGYDDNINSAPDAQPSNIPGLTLDSQSLERGDRFGKLIAGAQLYVPVAKGTKLYGRWDSSLRFYQDEHDQDFANHSLSLGSQWNRGSHQFDLSLNGQQYQLDHSRYRNLYGATAQWSRALNPRLALMTSLSWNYLEYADPSLRFRDSRQALANVRLFGQFELPTSPSWFAGAFYGDERPDDKTPSSQATSDRHFGGLQLGGQLTLAPDLSLLSSLTYQGSNYQGDDLILGIARDDDYYALDLALKRLLTRHWQLSLDANFSRNRSNIELYDYRRRQVGLNLRYDF